MFSEIRLESAVRAALLDGIRESWPEFERVPVKPGITVNLVDAATQITESIKRLHRVRELVVKDPDIRGGEPVFKGTRVPVHMIAAMLLNGDDPAEVARHYPKLTHEMIDLAPIYAAAHPRMGRPRKQIWHAHPDR